MCPHEILTVKGYALEDCYGEEWTRKYLECVADARIKKRADPPQGRHPPHHQERRGNGHAVHLQPRRGEPGRTRTSTEA